MLAVFQNPTGLPVAHQWRSIAITQRAFTLVQLARSFGPNSSRGPTLIIIKIKICQRASRASQLQKHAQMIVDMLQSPAAASPEFLTPFFEIGCHQSISCGGLVDPFAAASISTSKKSRVHGSLNVPHRIHVFFLFVLSPRNRLLAEDFDSLKCASFFAIILKSPASLQNRTTC